MRSLRTRIARWQPEGGFSLIEVMVAGLVLVVGLVMMSQFFASAVGRVLDSELRSVLHQVATQDLEQIRGLPYEDVGTVDGHPAGVLAEDEDRTVENLTVKIHREIIYWTDESYEGPYPANYRRVTLTVAAVGYDRLAPVELTSNVAGGAPGGSLDITVTDLQGTPVRDARIVITNDNLAPHVNIQTAALKTDSQGHILVPGLTPDNTPNYFVSVSKPGYNEDATDPGVVVQDGLPYTVVQLTIDRLASLRVRVIDTAGEPVEGLSVSVIGPAGFDEEFVSSAEGTTYANIRYSTDLDPYIVWLLEGQGYEPLSQEVVLEPGTSEEVVLTVPAGGPTTTTTESPGGTTTSTASTTTTLPGAASLTVRVVKARDGSPLNRAWVNLEGQNKITNRDGYVYFSPLELRTYSIVVTKNSYNDYRGDVVVSGATQVEIALTR